MMQKGIERIGHCIQSFTSDLGKSSLGFFSVVETVQTSRGPQGGEDFGSSVLFKISETNEYKSREA